MPVISVIVPIYNAERYIRECITSILIQTYSDWELLLVDDGSSDRSGFICDEFAQHDDRIRVFHTNNRGASSARNLGIKEMTGQWVIFVDADDYISSTTFEICMKQCIDNKLDLIQFYYSRSSLNNVCVGIGTPPLSCNEYIMKRKYLLCIGGSMISTSIINNNHIHFDEHLKLAEDQIFMMECLLFAKCLQRISNNLYFYRDTPNSITSHQQTKDILETINKLVDFKPRYNAFIPSIDQSICYLLVDLINDHSIPVRNIAKIVNKSNLSDSLFLTGTYKVFFYISRFSVFLAVIFVRIRCLFLK